MINTCREQLGIELFYSPFCRSIEEYLAEIGRDFSLVVLSRADVAWRIWMRFGGIVRGRRSCSTRWTCTSSARVGPPT